MREEQEKEQEKEHEQPKSKMDLKSTLILLAVVGGLVLLVAFNMK